MKMVKVPQLKIDWTNHLVGFVTTLLGIFIAFQLDDWQDRRHQKEQLEITLAAIKNEIENNIDIYKRNSSRLSQFTEYLDFMKSHTKNGSIIASEFELSRIRSKNPDRLIDLKFVKKYDDTLNVYSGDHMIIFDVIPEFGISTANWEAAKSTGILSYIDQAKIARLTQIYSWINKDVGFNDADFFKTVIFSLEELGSIEKFTYNYKMIAKVSQFKLTMIDEHYKKMNWGVE